MPDKQKIRTRERQLLNRAAEHGAELMIAIGRADGNMPNLNAAFHSAQKVLAAVTAARALEESVVLED